MENPEAMSPPIRSEPLRSRSKSSSRSFSNDAMLVYDRARAVPFPGKGLLLSPFSESKWSGLGLLEACPRPSVCIFQAGVTWPIEPRRSAEAGR